MLATAVITLAAAGQARSGVIDPPPIGGGALLPPVAVTGAAETFGTTTATVDALVTPNGGATTTFFEYGPTTSYGLRTGDAPAGAGLLPVAVSARLAGLSPGSLVHYRVVATNAAGTSFGGDRVLLTASAPGALLPPLPGAVVEGEGGRLGAGGGPGAATTGGSTAAAVATDATPTLGAPTTLAVRASDPLLPVTAFEVDFGEAGGRLVESACQIGVAPAVDRQESFAVTYAYRVAGRHRVTVDVFTGTCTRPARRLRRLVAAVDVVPTARAAAVRRGAGAVQAQLPTACPDADGVPTGRNTRRLERAVRCLVALERAARGRAPLRPNRKLTRAARGHTRDMLRRRYLAHSYPRGPTLLQRVTRVGYRARTGETIGVGAGPLVTPRAVVASWMDSSVHRRVLLGARYRSVGVAVLHGAPLPLGNPIATFVANLGTR